MVICYADTACLLEILLDIQAVKACLLDLQEGVAEKANAT